MNFYIVAHTHWDREWHKTFEGYRVHLVAFFHDLLNVLEKNPDFCSFMMDGQSVVYEDYLAIKPDERGRIEKLARSGQLVVGPWYTQPDEFIPSGEMMIRNLLIGQAVARQFGEPMPIGYLPDSFGQSAQIPQLLNGFGIQYAVFWRGITEQEISRSDFIWESADTSSVKTAVLVDGYGNARDLCLAQEVNEQIISENLQKLGAASDDKNLLLLCGFDQRPIKKELPEIVKGLNKQFSEIGNFKLSRLQDYLEAVFASGEKERVTGEFRKGKSMRVHISIGTTRSDIKQANYLAETELQKEAEPLSVLSALLDSEESRYPRELICQAAKYILQNQAHDSISSCCTDTTHTEMLGRYAKSRQIASELTEIAKKAIYTQIDFQGLGQPVLLFNLTGHRRQALEKIKLVTDLENFQIVDEKGKNIEFDLLSRAAVNQNDRQIEINQKNEDLLLYDCEILLACDFSGFGYQTIYLQKTQKSSNQKLSRQERDLFDGEAFDTDFLHLKIEADGGLTYTDKETGEVFTGLHHFVENGNAGDEYDYSPPALDKSFSPQKATVRLLHNSSLSACVKLTYRFDVPTDTFSDRRSEEMAEQLIESLITVKKDSKQVECQTTIHNQVRNHRISVQFPNNQALSHHFSEQQFGPLTRESTFSDPEIWQKEKWEENYYPVYPQQRYTGFENSTTTLLVQNKGLASYEILEHEERPVISLPLLTTTDYMGKQDLINRPGRRSGLHIATPDSEMIGTYSFDYSFAALDKERTAIAAAADQYQTALIVQQGGKTKNCGKLTEQQSLFTIENTAIGLQIFKKAESDEAYILRLVNHSSKEQRDVILSLSEAFSEKYLKISLVNFAEKEIENKGKISFDSQKVHIHSLLPTEVISLMLKKGTAK